MREKVFLILTLFLLIGCGPDREDDDISQYSGEILLTEKHGGYPDAWGMENCVSCHPLRRIHEGAENLKSIIDEKGYTTCFGCHGDNGTGRERSCMICHNLEDLPEVPYLEGPQQHSFETQPGYMSDRDCVVCHYASNMDGKMNLNMDLAGFPDAQNQLSSYQVEQDFCFRCHNSSHQQSSYPIIGYDPSSPRTGIEDFFTTVDAHGLRQGSGVEVYNGLRSGYSYQSLVKCSDCHQVHGTQNDALILDHSKRGVESLDISLLSSGFSVSTPDRNYAQLCVLCHVTTVSSNSNEDAGNGLTGLHAVTGDCSICHYHGESRF